MVEVRYAVARFFKLVKCYCTYMFTNCRCLYSSYNRLVHKLTGV